MGGIHMNNKIVWKFVLYSIILMILIPIITNYLMFIGDFKVAGDVDTWIGYLGSFWGAIIGGTISGAITLVGVRLTIKNQDRKEFINLYPQRKLAIDNYLTLIQTSKIYLQKSFGNDRRAIHNGQVFDQIDKQINLLQSSLLDITKVDGAAYISAKEVINNLKEIKKCIRHDYFKNNDDDDAITLEGYAVSDKLRYNDILQNIESILIYINQANKNLDEKYNKLTGNN